VVAFDTNAADLVPNDTNGALDVFVHNQQVKRGEGRAIDFTGTISDSDSTAWTGTVDFGDGSAPEPVVVDSAARTFTFSHAFPDNADYTLTVTITDAEGVSAVATGQVTIINVAPTVNAGGDVLTVEGTGFTSAGSISDPGAHDDPFSGEVNYGDGNGWEPLTVSGNAFVLAHTYADNGSYKVNVRIIDKDGGVGMGAMTVAVNNAVPVVSAGSDVVINEGDTYTQSASFTDAGVNDGPWEAWVSYGDPNDPGTVQIPITGNTFNLSHLYKENGIYKVIVSVTDKDGGTGFVVRKITVNNVAPSFIANSTSMISPSVLIMSSNFSDPGVLDTFSASIDWGDGVITANALIVERMYATYSYGIASGSHRYENAGTFRATLTVMDDDGGIVQRSATVVCTRPNIQLSCLLN